MDKKTESELRAKLLRQIAAIDALFSDSIRGRNDVAKLVPAMMEAKKSALLALSAMGDFAPDGAK